MNLDDSQYYKLTQFKNYQKSLQNEIGMFNQQILGCVDGWKSSNIGIDLYNSDKKI